MKVGKHSTGGVGDKTSIIVVAARGRLRRAVPKSSGRGLGHTGGTIDKLESIPGSRRHCDRDAFLARRDVGCAFVGQTADIAPADKKLYALRDVTGTDREPTAHRLVNHEQEIGEGTDALVLDVKVGRGRFHEDRGRRARTRPAMVTIGEQVGLRTEALLTRWTRRSGARWATRSRSSNAWKC